MKTILNQWSIYKMALAFLMLIFTVISCEKDDNFSDSVPDYTESIIQSFKVGTKYADILETYFTLVARPVACTFADKSFICDSVALSLKKAITWGLCSI